MKTFKQDHIVRDAKGGPLGKIILRNDNAYEEGKDIEVALLKIPLVLKGNIQESTVYIDGHPYKLPENLPKFRRNTRGKDWVLSSFILQRG